MAWWLDYVYDFDAYFARPATSLLVNINAAEVEWPIHQQREHPAPLSWIRKKHQAQGLPLYYVEFIKSLDLLFTWPR